MRIFRKVLFLALCMAMVAAAGAPVFAATSIKWQLEKSMAAATPALPSGEPSPWAAGQVDSAIAEELAFNVQYIRTGWWEIRGGNHPRVTVITSRSELNRYVRRHDTSRMGTPALLEASKTYTNDFFANNYLVVVMLSEGSGSIRHEVLSVCDSGDIQIRWLDPEGQGTDDMARWQIMIEISTTNRPDSFSVTILCDDMQCP